MKIITKAKLKEDLKTYKNNYELIYQRKNELYKQNIKMQSDVKEIIDSLLETLNLLDKEVVIDEIKIKPIDKDDIIEVINQINKKINDMKKENRILKMKNTKLKNKSLEVKVKVAPQIENGNKIIEEHFKNKEALSNGRF